MNEVLLHTSYGLKDVAKGVGKLTFERFEEMRKQWLEHLRFEWLITGHLTEDDALTIVNSSLSNITFTPLKPEEVFSQRIVNLKAKTVIDFDICHEDPANPNSAVHCIFQIGPKTYP